MVSPASYAKAVATPPTRPTDPKVLAPKPSLPQDRSIDSLLKAISVTNESVLLLQQDVREIRYSVYDVNGKQQSFDGMMSTMMDCLEDITKYMHTLEQPSQPKTTSFASMSSPSQSVHLGAGSKSDGSVLSTIPSHSMSADASTKDDPSTKNLASFKPSPTVPVPVPVQPQGTPIVAASFQVHPSVPPATTVPHAAVPPAPAPTATVPATAPPHSFHPNISPKPMITFQVTKWAKEIKDLVLSDKSFDELISWYEHLQQNMAIATCRHDVILEIESLHHTFSFRNDILPSLSSSVYKAAVLEYVLMA